MRVQNLTGEKVWRLEQLEAAAAGMCVHACVLASLIACSEDQDAESAWGHELAEL